VCWDGAGSPTLVKSLADPTVACIASRHAASLYGLEVIAEAIGNLERQSTRYFIIRHARLLVCCLTGSEVTNFCQSNGRI
jgi:prephenate dehydratase